MNIFEHLEIVESASQRTKAQILTADIFEAKKIGKKLTDDQLVSLHAVQEFRERIDATGNKITEEGMGSSQLLPDFPRWSQL